MNTGQTSVDTGGRGNTKPSPQRSRAWCFTLNNYTERERHTITEYLRDKTAWIVGQEVGETTGQIHLQGYFRNKNPIAFKTLKNINARWHLEPAQAGDEINRQYCSKGGRYETNIVEKKLPIKQRILEEYEGVTWKPWQQEILDLIDLEPDGRSIHWYWEPTGRVGKSFITLYIASKYEAIIASGKRDNIFNQVRTIIESGNEPEIIIVDIPRTNQEYVSYEAMEKLLDRVFYSGKYEGGQIFLPKLHLIVFANFEPDRRKMSEDRWNIRQIAPSSAPGLGTIPPGYWAPEGPRGIAPLQDAQALEFEV